MTNELQPGELDLLVDGLSDDVAFVWVLIHLRMVENPPGQSTPPTAAEAERALTSLRRLQDEGLIAVGHMEYVDGGPPGRVAPVRHVPDPDDVVETRVLEACRSGVDWEWSCWVANTDLGDAVARRCLDT